MGWESRINGYNIDIVRALVLAAAAAALLSAQPVAKITIDYPAEGSVFPPEFPPPTFLWSDSARSAAVWTIETGNGARAKPRVSARTWKPDAATWETIKKARTVTITGYRDAATTEPVSRGRVTVQVSTDPVGAPIFYREVPLMPSETEKGVIKPLAASAMPLIAWRLRNVAEPRSRLLMEGLHTCANCHSFSRDGQTMGMDVDGPNNDKGLYAIVPLRPNMSIVAENVVAWSTFRGKLGGKLRVGFMSQISPDGQAVVTTINDPGVDESEYQRRKNLKEVALNYYVANFKDYRFLQVFYPTRGILAWYSRATGMLQPLPGADDPRYVHTDAVWSPDASYLVFARAEAKDPYPPGARLAERANDPNETQIQYDLYRIPFNGGKGGRAEPIAGASRNGMSNSFPKVSPDGRWIVYVQARNGQLMRPDSQLYIVPAAGGPARRMRCNTPLMNSWHSFSPNGRWMVFSSKSRSPYTQMFLTHIDQDGNDSPAVLIENASAAKRAVNIPEFVNIPPDGLLKIDAPVTDYYRVVDSATELAKKGRYDAAAAEWEKALALSPDEAPAHNNLGFALAETGRLDEAVTHYRKALELSPEYPEAHNNLGEALVSGRRLDEAMAEFRRALELNPRYASAHSNLGAALAQQGRLDLAIPHLQQAVEYRPDLADAQNNLGVALAVTGRWEEAVPVLERAVKLAGGDEPMMLDLLGQAYARVGRYAEAVRTSRLALAAAARRNNTGLVEALKARIALYEAGKPAPLQ